VGRGAQGAQQRRRAAASVAARQLSAPGQEQRPTTHCNPPTNPPRNPFSVKFFLSLGDWTARIWNEDQRSPLFTGRYAPAYITGGSWSPTRPGVYYTTQMDGELAVWDLMHKHSEPSLQACGGGVKGGLGVGWAG
jgi:hypothetical protein